MKRSLIWTTVGATVIGFGVPAYAAVQSSKPQPRISTVVVPAAPKTTVDDSPRNSIDDNGVDITTNSIDDNEVDITTNTVDDSGHHNGGDDSGHGGSDG